MRNTQRLGDYVLAHGYVREDHVLDDDLPLWVPIPALAEVQVALERAVAQVTQLDGVELKRVMRTGTVASVDNRNWELRDHREPVQRLSQSRALSRSIWKVATIAANGFRFRVPYGTLLCVSDKPLHGELKLPGMADQFYRAQVDQHLQIGVKAMELLRMNGCIVCIAASCAASRRWRSSKRYGRPGQGLPPSFRGGPKARARHPGRRLEVVVDRPLPLPRSLLPESSAGSGASSCIGLAQAPVVMVVTSLGAYVLQDAPPRSGQPNTTS